MVVVCLIAPHVNAATHISIFFSGNPSSKYWQTTPEAYYSGSFQCIQADNED